MMAITTIYAIIMIVLTLFAIQGRQQGIYMALIRETLFVVPLVYMLQVLKRFDEKRSIIIAFTVFIYLDIIVSVLAASAEQSTIIQLAFNAAVLLFTTAVIVLLVQFFKIRNQEFLVPFCFFGFAYIFYFFIILLSAALSYRFKYSAFTKVGIFSVLLIPAAQLYVLSRIHKYLNTQEILNRSIAQLGTTNEAIN